jgi:hypothetical protein
MLAPAEAPNWAMDPKEFWRRAAAAEKRADAQEARLMELALPRGLSRAQWADIARKLALVFVAHGMVVQADIHCTTAADGKEYPHLHFQMSMRELINGEFAAKKARRWNKLFYGQATALRKKLADFLNAYCKKIGVAYEADPRSNAARGLPAAEMTLPRWNIISYKRTGKKTPWLEQRDKERAERANIAALEAECEELKQKIARHQLHSLGTRGTNRFFDIKRNETRVSRGPMARSRPPALMKSPPLDQITNDELGRGFQSQPGESSPAATWLPDLPNEPDELDTEFAPWRRL